MRVITKIGDVFSVKIDGEYKKYMQYISNDLTQLNSDVIRAFKKKYPIDENPTIESIIEDEIDFYAHCILKFGVKMLLWEKVGSNKNIGNLDNILFRGTKDYGHKVGDEPIRVSNSWHVWKINDEKFTTVKTLTEQIKKADIGLVYNPLGIIELMKNKKYPINYPDFEQSFQTRGQRANAAIAALAILPFGDIAKAVKIQTHHIIPRAVFRDAGEAVQKAMELNGGFNLKKLPTPFHGNHPQYNTYVTNRLNKIENITEGSIQSLQRDLNSMLNTAYDNYKATGQNLNDYFRQFNID